MSKYGYLGLMLIAWCLVFSAGLYLGQVSIPLADVADALVRGHRSSVETHLVHIVVDIRLKRVVLAAMVGAGLGAAGAGYQGLFRNPLADPFVIGASSGAALGATVAIILGLNWIVAGIGPVPWFALVGALAAVGVVYGIASQGGQTPTMSLLLGGVAVSSFASAMVSLLMCLNVGQLMKVYSWLQGSFADSDWQLVLACGPLIGFGVFSLWVASRTLDALAFGEETASSLGLGIHGLRGWIVVAASLTTAACVSASGLIGFVGLVAPHAARMTVGPRHYLLIPASCLLGSILLMIADHGARVISADQELPVGVLTALLGGPFFLYLLKTRQTQFGG